MSSSFITVTTICSPVLLVIFVVYRHKRGNTVGQLTVWDRARLMNVIVSGMIEPSPKTQVPWTNNAVLAATLHRQSISNRVTTWTGGFFATILLSLFLSSLSGLAPGYSRIIRDAGFTSLTRKLIPPACMIRVVA